MTAETMADRPTISLIIPAYNEEAYLGACLDAVMANVAGKALEIIVIDNNSTDGTRAVAERYPAVTYVFEPEKGITRARQRGFLTARGDILAYVDADTHPEPSMPRPCVYSTPESPLAMKSRATVTPRK